MKIAFYAPFKPLGHHHPSGDLAIARGLVDYLVDQGNQISVQSKIRCRWIYLKPWQWLFLVKEILLILRRLLKDPPDLWLTYHSYYKAPDLIGPLVCRFLGIKYAIFQGIYATKYRRRLKTCVGFYLNRIALKMADHVFTNKKRDLINLERLLPKERITYVKPGIRPDLFQQNIDLGKKNQKLWCNVKLPVIVTAAMFRDDVKTRGLIWLIQCLGRMAEKNEKFHLLIAGSGIMEQELKKTALNALPGMHTFVGKVDRNHMPGFYSAGDLFAFPGINESLGMVFLEAQSCGLPVVAFDNAGVPEAVNHGKTGLLVKMYDCKGFTAAVGRLISDTKFAQSMGQKGMAHIRQHHDLGKNYSIVEKTLREISELR